MLTFTHHLPHFRLVDPQTGAIPKTRTKRRKENEKVSLETTFSQLLLEYGSMTLLCLWLFHLQRTLWPFQSCQGLRDNDGMNSFLLMYLEDLEIQIQPGRMGLMVPTLLLYWKI
jgi:hypothetical protein